MTNWLPISYRGYWDVPRIVLVRHDGQPVVLSCPFSEELDDYPDEYEVFTLPPDLHEEDLPPDWTELDRLAVSRLGRVPIDQVRFDPGHRHIDAAVLDQFTAGAVRLGGPADRG